MKCQRFGYVAYEPPVERESQTRMRVVAYECLLCIPQMLNGGW